MKYTALLLLFLPFACAGQDTILVFGDGVNAVAQGASQGDTVAGAAEGTTFALAAADTTASPTAPEGYFRLEDSATVSVGVYAANDTLLRQVGYGQRLGPGLHEVPAWDGRDRDGRDARARAVETRVAAHDIRYQWRGAQIGNTSTQLTGYGRHRAYTPFFKLLAIGDWVYYSCYYNEKSYVAFKFHKDTPNVPVPLLGGGANTKYLAADDEYVYWSCEDYLGPSDGTGLQSWVFATRRADDRPHTFAHATPVAETAHWHDYPYALGAVTADQSWITGLARSGRYLFIARQMNSTIHVLDVEDGARVVRVIREVKEPRELATDAAGRLWMLHGANDLSRFDVRADGTLSEPRLTAAPSPAERLSVTVVPGGESVTVSEAGERQQLVYYSTSDGREVGAFGQRGGMIAHSAVEPDRFYLTGRMSRQFDTDVYRKQRNHASVAYLPDGSFWVVDPGNFRAVGFRESGQAFDAVMHLNMAINCTVDVNDPTRVFLSYQEFAYDYSESDPRGAWRLVANWEPQLGDLMSKDYTKFNGVATLANGRTYALIGGPDGRWDEDPATTDERALAYVYELTPGGLRDTETRVRAMPAATFRPDGNVWGYSPGVRSEGKSFAPSQIYSFALEGFEGADPRYAAEREVLASVDPVTPTSPVFLGDTKSVPAMTSDSGFVFFNPIHDEVNGVDGRRAFHLGLVKPGGKIPYVRAAPPSTTETPRLPSGYPADGSFDVTNEVWNAGGMAATAGATIVYNYIGEGWRGGFQTNMWSFYHENGLFLTTEGATWKDSPAPERYFKNDHQVPTHLEPFAGMAGNVQSYSIVAHPDREDTWVLFTGDENWFAGGAATYVEGLGSVREIVLPWVKTAGR